MNFACDSYLGGLQFFRAVCLLLMLRIKTRTKRGLFDLQPQKRNLKKYFLLCLSKEVNGTKIKFACLCYVNLLKSFVRYRIANIKTNKAKK